MRILFVEPPVDYPNRILYTGIPLGLLTIGSYLIEHGAQAEIRLLSEQIELAAGLPESSLATILSSWAPDIVCISSITGQFPRTTKIAEEAKRIGATVILGNIYPSLNAEEIVGNDPNVDIVVRGDGEQVLLEIVNHITAHTDWHATNGITYRLENKVVSNPAAIPIDLCQLIVPAYDLLPLDTCRKLDLDFSLETSRGCPYDCTFCTLTEEVWPRYRVKTIEQVLKECDAIAKLGFKRVRVTDDTFTVSRDRVIDLCRELERAKLNLEFYVMTRIDLLDQQLLDHMISAGVKEMLFGAEQIE